MNAATEFPLVSVVLATYNGETFLAKQLESVFEQTYPNIEIIAVDDGSSDNTISILQDHASRHPAMKVFSNETNLGFIKNFQRGCGLATGELIACCDQDDYWHADKIKKMTAAIGNHPMIYCDSVLCDEELHETGKKISDLVVCRSFNSCLQQAVFCRIYGHATLIKRSLLQKAIPFLEIIPHDWWLSYLATLYGEIKYLPEPLVFYRQHTANLIGMAGVKREKTKQLNKGEKKSRELTIIRARINAFYAACPDEKIFEKEILYSIKESYRSFSFINNCRRVIIFLRYQDLLLAVKKRSSFRKLFFCFKMFVMIK
jgi:glycosyltransferase involved in cell wall biosynthesis